MLKVFKKSTITLIICLIGSLAVLTLLLLFKPAEEFHQEEAYKLDDIDEIAVNSAYADVQVKPAYSDELKISFYGKEKSIPKLVAKKGANKITIALERPFAMTLFDGKMNLDIYVPKSYQQDLRVETSARSISLNDLKLAGLYCGTSSGELQISSVETENTELKTASGNTEVDGFSGNLKASSSAGSIHADYIKFQNNVSIETASGEVMLQLPDNAEFILDARTSSGTVKSGFKVNVSGTMEKNVLKGSVDVGSNGVTKNSVTKNSVTLITASGDITLKKAVSKEGF